MTRYDNGRALEYRVRDLLVEAGYFVVRSAGSKGPVDVVAVPYGMPPESTLGATLLVQCKRGGSLPPAEWNELYRLAERLGAVAVLAEYTPRKPITFWRLTGPKDGTTRTQPRAALTLAVADAG